MAGGINKVIVIGNLGADPEVKYTTGGNAVAKLRLATNESWTDKNGQKQERTEWHRVIVWGKLAELCGQYLSKGRQAYVEGRLQTRDWTDKEGVKRYTTEIVANTVQFLGGAGERQGQGGFASSQPQSGAAEPGAEFFQTPSFGGDNLSQASPASHGSSDMGSQAPGHGSGDEVPF